MSIQIAIAALTQFYSIEKLWSVVKQGIKTRLVERAAESLPELSHEDFKQQIVKRELSKVTEEQGQKCARAGNRAFLLQVFEKRAFDNA